MSTAWAQDAGSAARIGRVRREDHPDAVAGPAGPPRPSGVVLTNLCFHGVGVPGRALEPGEARYWVDPGRLAGLLDVATGRPDVRLSFDDGNASDVAIALPALRRRGLRAAFFVVAGRLDRPGSLRAADVRALTEAGMTVGSHGLAHRPWRGMDAATRRAELVEARERIAEAAGRPVVTAALPLGQYDRALLAELRRLGYARVYSSDAVPADERAWLQPRTSVEAGTDPAALARLLDRPGRVAATTRRAWHRVKALR